MSKKYEVTISSEGDLELVGRIRKVSEAGILFEHKPPRARHTIRQLFPPNRIKVAGQLPDSDFIVVKSGMKDSAVFSGFLTLDPETGLYRLDNQETEGVYFVNPEFMTHCEQCLSKEARKRPKRKLGPTYRGGDEEDSEEDHGPKRSPAPATNSPQSSSDDDDDEEEPDQDDDDEDVYEV